MFCPDKNELNDFVDACVCRYQAGDTNALDDIYEHISQFCLRVISKTCGKYITPDDEEAEIIGNVIMDALDKYNFERGSFMVYLGQVVRNRTIDGLRKGKRSPSVAMSDLDTDNMLPGTEQRYMENIIDDMARKEEIQIFAKLLTDFALSFSELAHVTPRHSKTRRQAQRAALLIAQDHEICTYLLTKRMLPHKLMEVKFSLNRGILDRYRKYIIAAVLIHVYDLVYLKPYVSPVMEEGEQWLELKA